MNDTVRNAFFVTISLNLRKSLAMVDYFQPQNGHTPNAAATFSSQLHEK